MKFLPLILFLVALSFGIDTTRTIENGDWYVIRNQVKWGASNTLIVTSTSTQDTASAVVVGAASGTNNIKPSTVFSLSYYGKATDSTSSLVTLYIDTKYCTFPATQIGCDSLWTLAGEHDIYSTQNIVDTLVLSNKHGGYVSNTTSELYIPHANLFRFRAHRQSVASGKTAAFGSIWLLGQ